MTVQPEAPETEERSGLSRRTVIKGAAHAAWMVPAITVVTQAPALAASGPASLSVTPTLVSGWTSSGPPSSFTLSVRVDNANSQATTGLVVSLTFPNTSWTPKASTPSDGKWAVGGNGTSIITFSPSPRGGQLAGNGSVTFTTTITAVKQGNAGNKFTLKLAATAGAPGTDGANQIVIPKYQ